MVNKKGEGEVEEYEGCGVKSDIEIRGRGWIIRVQRLGYARQLSILVNGSSDDRWRFCRYIDGAAVKKFPFCSDVDKCFMTWSGPRGLREDYIRWSWRRRWV